MTNEQISKFNADLQAFSESDVIRQSAQKVSIDLQRRILAEIKRHDRKCKKPRASWVIEVT